MRTVRSLSLRLAAVVAGGLLVATVPACSSDDSSSSSSTTAAAGGDSTATTTTTAPERQRTDGPAATFAPLTGGKGTYLLTTAGGTDLADAGYTSTEYAASGTAAAYSGTAGAIASGSTVSDGMMTLTPTTEAAYSTRVVVRRPTDPKAFNGTVVVEWLNVSSGGDAAPDYTYLADELLRKGYAWAGVSAQRIGIEGGPVAVAVNIGIDTGAGKGIKNIDPDRYGTLSHPGDAYSYDIFTQVGRGLRETGAGSPLADLGVQRLLAAGESQSAFALTTYVDGIQPLTRQFDGFLIHSRGGAAAPLGEAGTGIDIAGTIFGPPTRLRTDLDVPTLVVQTETDVLGVLNYYPARQDDTDRLRIWEIAGTAHADRFQIGPVETALGCGTPINDGQQAFVLRAGLRALDAWAAGGDAPLKADRLAVSEASGKPAFVLDDVGNVTGGIRTPVVDVPTAVLSGLPGPNGSIVCTLMGTTAPLSADAIAARYPGGTYATKYAAATDAAIEAGFLLRDDRDAVIADARPTGAPAA